MNHSQCIANIPQLKYFHFGQSVLEGDLRIFGLIKSSCRGTIQLCDSNLFLKADFFFFAFYNLVTSLKNIFTFLV